MGAGSKPPQKAPAQIGPGRKKKPASALGDFLDRSYSSAGQAVVNWYQSPLAQWLTSGVLADGLEPQVAGDVAQGIPCQPHLEGDLMPRIRTIKPEFFKHSGLFDAEKETELPLRLGFAGLWTCCDRAGRFKWRPRELKLDALPYDECDFSRVLDALATRGFIVKYACGTDFYGYVPSWSAHQFLNNKEPDSKLPQPPLDEHVTPLPVRVDDATDTRGVKEGKEIGKDIGNIQKPSPKPRKRRVSEDGMVHSENPRHKALKAAIETYWKSRNEIPMPWDGSEGAQLGMWESANPKVTTEQFTMFLRNRFKSEVNHSERPSKWIRNITSFANGPLNEYGKPIKPNGGFHGRENANDIAVRESIAADQAGIGPHGDGAGSEDGLFSHFRVRQTPS